MFYFAWNSRKHTCRLLIRCGLYFKNKLLNTSCHSHPQLHLHHPLIWAAKMPTFSPKVVSLDIWLLVSRTWFYYLIIHWWKTISKFIPINLTGSLLPENDIFQPTFFMGLIESWNCIAAKDSLHLPLPSLLVKSSRTQQIEVIVCFYVPA